MLRKALLILAFVAVPVVAPAQQPAAPKTQSNASVRADTTKAKPHRRRAAHKAKTATPASRDTTKSKP